MISFKRLLIAGLFLSCATFSMSAMQYQADNMNAMQAQQKLAALLSAAKLKAKFAKTRIQYTESIASQQPNNNNLSRNNAYTILLPFVGFLNNKHKEELKFFLSFPPEGVFTHKNICEFLQQFPDIITAFQEYELIVKSAIIEQARQGMQIAQAQLDLIRNVTKQLEESQNYQQTVTLMIEELEQEEKKDTEIKREFNKFQSFMCTVLKQAGIRINPCTLIAFINYLLDKGLFDNITAIHNARNLTNEEARFINNAFTLFSQSKKNSTQKQEFIEFE